MTDPIEILLVDDHMLMTEGYSNILRSMDEYKFNFTTANDCESAVNILSDSERKPFELVLLDVSLPGASKLKIYSGEDLGIFIRQNFPGTKIIIMTMHSENFRIYSLLKTVKPEGFLLKSEVTSEEVKLAVQQVLKRKSFYSHTINNLLRNHLINDIKIDTLDRTILHFLSKGVKTKDLSKNIPLSTPSIEKRKRLIKEKLDIPKCTDLELVDKAKHLGFI